MAKQINSIQKKTLNTPDEVRIFNKGKVELATVGTVTFGRASFEPGWKWSESVKPIVKTEYCEAPHVQYHISGRLKVRMADGSEEEFGPGDVGVIPSGHDAWVVGNEPVVAIDISGMTHYAKPAAKKVVKKSDKAKTGKKKR
jgi:mannose-6-phosphate isomerase-like protein (cupin superfamily)